MIVDQHDPVRTFVLLPERDLGHTIADKLREDPAIQVIGVSTDPDKDAYWIYDADPDLTTATFVSGGALYLADLTTGADQPPTQSMFFNDFCVVLDVGGGGNVRRQFC